MLEPNPTQERALFSAPRGTGDVLPDEQPYWQKAIQAAEKLCQLFGYGRIDTPAFEQADLFERGAGEGSDVVRKEMYVFEDRSGERLALRPEGTPPVCRAYLEHGMSNLPQPVRLYYVAPTFRYERPQAGRRRQHTQFGCEALGDADAAVDAEVVEILWRLYAELGLHDLVLLLNSIGDRVCRPRYLEALRAYYEPRLGEVCRDCRERYERNPLRLLDCKQTSCQPVIAGAPSIIEYLCDDCLKHFEQVRRYLDGVRIPYEITPHLVRGLDYYTRTVFEIMPRGGGAQSTIGAGGRYDYLIEELGGKPTPGVGFATGVERIVLNMKRRKASTALQGRPVVYVAYQGDGTALEAFKLASLLRREGIPATAATGERSLRSQMRQANALKAKWAAIIGERELAAGTVQLRDMAGAEQREIPKSEAIEFLAGIERDEA
jgi:histidyl-tRNA synthetase